MSCLSNCERHNSIDQRSVRKLDHISSAMLYEEKCEETGFGDIHIIHNCLTKVDFDKIVTRIDIFGKVMENPIVINAITGGAKETEIINEKLAEVAKVTGCALAVGSQCAGVLDKSLQSTYQVVRRINSKGVIFANVGAYSDINMALSAIEMIEADALQIHLNAAQEIIMSEGDRNFSEILKNIEAIVRKSPVPVIIKETGCGMAYEQLLLMASVGVRNVDVGGKGGTNFIAIEDMRNKEQCEREFIGWGIPTVISLLEARKVSKNINDFMYMSSGGVRSALDIVKSLALGASAVGIARPVLEKVEKEGLDACILWLEKLIADLKKYMLLLGVDSIDEICEVPVVVTGFTAEWMNVRNIKI